LDHVELNGPAARDLSLETVPTASSITPVETTSFWAEIRSNQDDVYTLTVAPPSGWQAQVDSSGHITITPALNAEPGVYPVHVAAESASANPAHPLFSTAVHTVTILPWQGAQSLPPPRGKPEGGHQQRSDAGPRRGLHRDHHHDLRGLAPGPAVT